MCEKSCPKCGSEAHVASYISLIFSFELLDIALILAAIVWTVGMFESLPGGAVLLFCVLAAAPVLMVIQRKEFCESCEIEFIARPFRAVTQLPSQIKK